MISVIIPLYNAEKSIEKTLDSIRNQTWKGEFEIFVVNDGSTDGSAAVVESYMKQRPLKITLLNQENLGVSVARNAAMRLTTAEYIALLDADDEWLPDKTERQMDVFEDRNLDVDFLGCLRKNQKILWPFRVQKNNLAKVTFRKLLLRNEVQPSTVIFKTEILKKTSFFGENFRFAEDLNFWLKISEHCKMYILNEELILAGAGKRSFGVSGLSANLLEMEKGFQRNLKELLALKKIGFAEYGAYFAFYKMKFLVRIARNFYFKKQGR
ncbi:Glycosyltransferase involved in cell wall bisynthesis [Kaistella treverensis]|uniref:Glycosyltransferase involved in cell wall bisynthesis n=1 Tax=Kaistella treverensis TaxID=631455 RepID=A0A1I3JP46_9FLAO|nr:glycosyltransferase family A protein [Kaistella treverensis]SFI61675.1 Glycosyltransferase involved in cell wall bisynthesis [Kaistella treverensis]